MEKTRVPKGEHYYYINVFGEVVVDLDYRIDIDNQKYKNGNYFLDKESAESMARKLRAVLAGADVIEMPSEDEIKERLNMIIPTQPVEPWCVEGYCKHIIEFILSKIIK